MADVYEIQRPYSRFIADAFRQDSRQPAGKKVRAYAGIVVNVDEHKAVLRKQRSIAGYGVIVKRHAVHSACNTGIVGAIDFGRCKEKRRSRFEHARHACERCGLIAAREVKHHPPRNCRVETAVENGQLRASPRTAGVPGRFTPKRASIPVDVSRPATRWPALRALP